MLVFARRSLVPRTLPTADDCALLLEGDWDHTDAQTDPGRYLSLDSSIDAARFAYLDADAERLTTQIIAAAECATASEHDGAQPNFADINALRLRYESVRWLRLIAFWRDRQRTAPESEVELYVSPRRDREYVLLCRALAHAFDLTLRIHFVLDDQPAAAPLTLPRNAWWRRLLGRLVANRATRSDHVASATSDHRPRVLFVGNPRILDAVCDTALDRGAGAAWLYDRFAVGAWLRRRTTGVAQFTCDAETSQASHHASPFPLTLLQAGIAYAGIDLSAVAEAWYRRLHRQLGPAQARQWERVGAHLASLRPTHVVLDEDATPLARIAIAHARRLGIPSVVVQHGICCVRFGFAPLAADLFCAWNEGTQRQLLAWTVAPQRIVVTGAPTQQDLSRDIAHHAGARPQPTPTATARRRIVLLATMPPRDDRPDAVEFHLTTRTYEAMLYAACAAVSELSCSEAGHAELIIKPHPRCLRDTHLVRVLQRFPQLRQRIVANASLAEVLADADCVLSCVSSAGVDAAVAGLPVVQLLPQGSGPILPAEWYGLLGSARSLAELRPLLHAALNQSRRTVAEPTGTSHAGAAAKIVDLLFAPQPTRHTDDAHPVAKPHFMQRRPALTAEDSAHG